jgi:hypothetical protein
MTNDRFPVLSKLARVATAVGWAIIGVGCIAAFVGFVGTMKAMQEREELEQITGGVLFAGGGFAALAGLLLIIFAEVVGVLFAIEGNTRVGSKYFGGAPGGRLPDGDDSGER